MKLIKRILLIALLPLVATGCSMCCGPYDYDYSTFGGLHQRVDPQHGRVGSVFSDPMAGFNGAGADSNLKDPPELDARPSYGSETDGELDLKNYDLDSLPDPTEQLPEALPEALPESRTLDEAVEKQTRRLRRGLR